MSSIKPRFPKSLSVHYLKDGSSSLRSRLGNLDPKPGSFFSNDKEIKINRFSTCPINQQISGQQLHLNRSPRAPVQLSRSKPLLQTIYTQDIITWKQTTSSSLKCCEWTELQHFTISRNSISPFLWNHIDKAQNTEEIFIVLFKRFLLTAILIP